MNRDESDKCIEIAERKLREGDITGARKFASKAASLHNSSAVEQLLRKIDATPASSAKPAFSSGASTARETPPLNRQHSQPSREYTTEQAAVVARIRKCKGTQFYEILSCSKTSTDSEIKKAYRRLALQLHPDKNGAPGADEAFKMVSRAFQILSDEGKREQFDRYGADPDSRAAPPTSGFSQRRNGGGGMQPNGMFGDELNADDLFNMFFGGGGGGFGGQGFGGGNPFVSFGGPGVRVHHFGGGNRRPAARAGQEGQAGGRNTLIQLLPLFMLFAFSILSSLFSSESGLFGSSTPSYSFSNSPPYTVPRYTSQHKIAYFTDPSTTLKLSTYQLSQLDKKAELNYIRGLREMCEQEYALRERKMNDAYGFFSVDTEAYNKARNMKMESCEELSGYGYRR